MKLPMEIIEIIIENILDPLSFRSMYLLNKNIYYHCKEIEMNKCKMLLDYYQVDYMDPTNFIYIKNNVRQNWFRESPFHFRARFNYHELMTLYIRCIHYTVVHYEYEQNNGYYYNPSDKKIHIDDEKFNINRFSCRNPRSLWEYAPNDADYPLQLVIRRLRKQWDKYRYSYDVQKFAKSRVELHNAYRALLYLQYNYVPNDSYRLPWYTYAEEPTDEIHLIETTNISNNTDIENNNDTDIENNNNTNIENNNDTNIEDENTDIEDDNMTIVYNNELHNLVDMCYITSIPFFENLVELNCNGQHIRELPNFPNLKILYCSRNPYLHRLPHFQNLRVIHALFTPLILSYNHFPKISDLKYSPYEQGYTNLKLYYPYIYDFNNGKNPQRYIHIPFKN
jgi:hypothetical protein